MLGNISPRTLKIDASAVVFPGRDSTVALTIKIFDGRAHRKADLSGITRWVLALPELGAVFDSDVVPGVFSVSDNVLTLDLDGYAIPDSVQPCLLVAHDEQHPNGQVLVDNADCVVSLVFRNIGAAGSLPMPAQPTSNVTAYTAGAALSGHRAVYSDGSVVRPASADNLSSAERCVGVTTQAAEAGAKVQVRRQGTMSEPTWSWTPGPVFLALNGALTQVAPASGVLLQIGVALDATTLDVRVGTPALLD